MKKFLTALGSIFLIFIVLGVMGIGFMAARGQHMIEAFGKFVTWTNTNAGILSIIVAILLAVIPAVWSFILYLNLKNHQLHFDQFKIYHQLIRDLVQPGAAGDMYQDRQIAIVFELRHFPDYYELTYRMLQGLKATWQTNPNSQNWKRLLDEVTLTNEYIAKKLNRTQHGDAINEESRRKEASFTQT